MTPSLEKPPATIIVAHANHFVTCPYQDFGNDRVNAIGTDAGTVHLLSVDRGPTVLNYMDSSRMAYGGGYSYITFNEVEGTSGTEDGERVEKKAGAAKTVYTSAFEWDGERDQEKRTQRVFGLGYGCSYRYSSYLIE